MAARRRRKTPEQDLQKAVAGYLRVALRPPTIWTAIGHGGGGALRGAILKGMGVQPGWPDILIMHPAGADGMLVTRILGIELKAKRGSLSPEQRAMVNAFKAAGALLVTCRSIDDVEDILRANGVPLSSRIIDHYGLRSKALRNARAEQTQAVMRDPKALP